ncbi:MAG TPA: CorA family divalent cation transporter [Euzebyales bacterium]
MLTVRWHPVDGLVRETIGSGDVDRLLAGDAPADSVLWLDASQPDEDELDAVAAIGGITRQALSRLLRSPRPGVHGREPATTVVLSSTGTRDGMLHAEVLVLIATSTVVVTCARYGGAGALTDEVAERLAASDTPTAGDVLEAVSAVVVDGLWDDSDQLDDRLATAERASVDDTDDVHGALQALRHDILVLHRVVGPLRRVLAEMIDAGAAVLGAEDVAALRRSHDAIVELRTQIDTQLLLLNGLSHTQVLAASNRANEVMQATSSWGAILVVATLITGVYGMNFQAMPELRWELGYPFALLLIVASTLVLYRLFRSRGWL